MKTRNYEYIYGPVPSWRLGSSLGIDPLSYDGKVCTFDCIYCQLGRTKVLTDKRKIYVPVAAIIEELDSLPPLEIDYITFSGAAEPTLAENLGDIIRAIRKIRKERIAVLTNSSLLHREDVQKDLLPADLIVAKLDASSQEVFEIINRPINTVSLDTIVLAIKKFKNIYKGEIALQIMFIEKNKRYASEIARIAKEINPDEVQINTPLRPCNVKPLQEEELSMVESHFNGLNTISVYRVEKRKIKPISTEDTLKRRGKL